LPGPPIVVVAVTPAIPLPSLDCPRRATITPSEIVVLRSAGGCIRGRERDKRAHREINNQYDTDNITEARCESGGLRHNGKNDIYSHAETSGARRGAFFRFSPPTLPIF
jgi:hypothetical protein